MWKSKHTRILLTSVLLVSPGLAHANWVDEVCKEHPKREFCTATICEKLSQGCLRFAVATGGRSGSNNKEIRYVLTPYRGGAGSNDRELQWLKDGPVVDTSGANKTEVDPVRLYQAYAEKNGKAMLPVESLTSASFATKSPSVVTDEQRKNILEAYQKMNYSKGSSGAVPLQQKQFSDSIKNNAVGNSSVPAQRPD